MPMSSMRGLAPCTSPCPAPADSSTCPTMWRSGSPTTRASRSANRMVIDGVCSQQRALVYEKVRIFTVAVLLAPSSTGDLAGHGQLIVLGLMGQGAVALDD